MTDISIIIPVRDEASNIPELSARLGHVMERMYKTFEIIYITDVNKDKTLEILRNLNTTDYRIKFIKLSRSYGQNIAVLAGLEASSGTYAVIMDGDLQDCPEDIPLLFHKIIQGYEIVYAVKQHKNDRKIQDYHSKLFLWVISHLSDLKMDFNTNMYRIISRKVINYILKYKEIDPNLTLIMGAINLPTYTVEVTSARRQFGKSKYSFSRKFRLALNSILSFSTKPIEFVSLFGLGLAILSLIYLIIVLIQSFMSTIPVMGWTTIISLIILIGGMQLFALGIIGQYIGKIFLQTKQRPLYIIEEMRGFDAI